MFANVYQEKGYPFAKHTDITVQQAIGQVEQHSIVPVNWFDTKPVYFWCIQCCEEAHREHLEAEGKSYYKEDGRPSSYWLRQSRSSKNAKMSNKRVERVLKMHDEKTNNTGVSSYEVYNAMQNNMLNRAMDWITELGGSNAFMWLLYGCTSCQQYPVRSSDWYRVTRDVKADLPGGTNEGEGTGFWHCAACFTRWNWATSGAKRLVVIGEADEHTGFKEGYSFAYIGHASSALDNKIQFLRTANALTRLGGKPVTKETLLEVIAACNESVFKKFSKGMKEVHEIKSKIVHPMELQERAVHLTCESRHLSMRRMGDPFLAVDVSKTQVHDIDIGQFEFLIDVSAAMLDVEATAPNGAQTRRLKWKIMDSEGFQMGRRVLRSKI